MGFDLTAKNKGLGDKGYFRADIYQMILLRTSMVVAGVDERLVYGKFSGNNGLFVTALQSRKIAKSLASWLKGRKLTVTLSERNPMASVGNEVYFGAIRAVGGREDKRALRQSLSLKSQPLKLDPKFRKFVRRFAEFSKRSEGFWVS